MKRQTSNSKLQKKSTLPKRCIAKSRRIESGYENSWDADGQQYVLNDGPNSDDSPRHPFDLEERTARFGEAIIRFTKRIPRGPGNDRLIGQLVGCGTSVGANYCEANNYVSKRDFTFSISRCAKEAHESKHFLRMTATAEPTLADDARVLYREANELHLIFISIKRGGGSTK
jgi:four helix bundle protein